MNIPDDLFEAYRAVLLAADKATRGTAPAGVSRSAWAQLRRAVQAAQMAQARASKAGISLHPEGEKSDG